MVKYIQGDVFGVYNSTGANKVAEYAYDAYGNCTIVSQQAGVGTLNPFRYRGYYWDIDLGLYYLQTRYYDPATGRFINADGLEYLNPQTLGGINLYSYCLDNPVMNVDSSGHMAISIFVALTRLICGLVALYLAAVAATMISANIETAKEVIDPSIRLEDDLFSDIAGLISSYAWSLEPKNEYDYKERHHIVARKDRRAERSRQILDEVGIGINDKINLVDVNNSFHRVMHTNVYYAILNLTISLGYYSAGKEGVEAVLLIYQRILGGLG